MKKSNEQNRIMMTHNKKKKNKEYKKEGKQAIKWREIKDYKHQWKTQQIHLRNKKKQKAASFTTFSRALRGKRKGRSVRY